MLPENIKFLQQLFEVAVSAADPMKVLPDALPEKPSGRVLVIGAGKASARMAEAVESAWGPCEGLVITRYGYGRPTKGIEIVEAAHPVSDEAGMLATRRILQLLESTGEDDFVLALISGGGSSLFCAPAGNMTLADKQKVHQVLLKSGAPIAQMNVVRKHISMVKGGQLAAAAYPAQMLSLLISDVPGDNPADIASGPTVGETSSLADVQKIINTYHLDLPQTALDVLEKKSSVKMPGDPLLSKTINKIVAAPSSSLATAQSIALNHGSEVRVLGDAIEGEAREEALRQVKLACKIQRSLKPGDKSVLLLSGGECTVSNWGGGVGGPNAEFALAAAIALKSQPGIYLLACDTDGVDGAAEVAGAWVSPETLKLADRAQVDPALALQNSDSHSFFAKIDAQIITGPTLTNVNDFRAVLISPLA
ncbi:MAG: glycerate kinase [Devosiaceae bacterium]|nr:glycerate kinase [Devosiaceae bacterium]